MCNINALKDHLRLVEHQLSEQGFRVEASLSSLDSEEDLDALISIETGDLVEPPDQSIVSLMQQWSSLTSEISATEGALACGFASLAESKAHQAVVAVRHAALQSLKEYQHSAEASKRRREWGVPHALVIPPSIEKRLLMISNPVVSTESTITLAPPDAFLNGTTIEGALRITSGFDAAPLMTDASKSCWTYDELLQAMNSKNIAQLVRDSGDIADVYIGNVWLGSTEI